MPKVILKGKDLYDNIYAGDTLVSDEYSDAVDYDSQFNNNSFHNNQGYDYYSDSPYSNRLRMFYGNYFDPYRRDPFYFDYGYPSFGCGFGYGGGYNNYYGYGGFPGDYYGGGYYPGYFGGYYGGFGSYYSGFSYSGISIHNDNKSGIPYVRNVRPSTMSSKWNSNVGGIGSLRRDSYSASVNSRVGGRTSGTPTTASNQRRITSSGMNTQQALNEASRKSGQDQTKQVSVPVLPARGTRQVQDRNITVLTGHIRQATIIQG